jgi:ElaA protein
VLTTLSVRRQGVGKALLREAMRGIDAQYPGCAVRIAAQQYLERFYEAFGFRTVSAPYNEDGIVHVEMLRFP